MIAGDLTALLLSLREGVEMALVVGIVLAYLGQAGARGARRFVWAGVAAAAAVSLVALGVLTALDAEFQGATEQLFEGTTMLLAAVFLTWMVFWMLRNARFLRTELQRGVQAVLESGGAAWGVFLLVFFAVVRDGVELALLVFSTPGQGKILGTVVGLAIASGIGLLIYAFGRRIDLRTFFRVTLPLAFPAVVAGSIFTFSLTLGDYIAPKLITSQQFIGTLIYDNHGTNLPVAAAFTLVPIVVMIVYLLVARRLGAFDAL